MEDNQLTSFNQEAMLEGQIFLLNRFNAVYNVRKSNECNLKALRGSILDDVFIDVALNCEEMADGTFLSSVTISNINAEFIGWSTKEHDSLEKAMTKGVDYLTDLSSFITAFKKRKFKSNFCNLQVIF